MSVIPPTIAVDLSNFLLRIFSLMVRNVHEINSTTKPDLAGRKPARSKSSLDAALDLPDFVLTWQVWF